MSRSAPVLEPTPVRSLAAGSIWSRPSRSPSSERCGVGEVCEPSRPDLRFAPLTDETVRAGWSELLARYQWDTFATLTYGGSVWCDEKIVRNFRTWLFRWQEFTAIERGLLTVTPGDDGERVKRRGPWWNNYRKGRAFPTFVLGIEPHKSGKLHAHAIIRWSPLLPNLEHRLGKRLWYEGKDKGGFGFGFARTESPRCQNDVADYVAKYVTKGGEIVLSASFDAARLVAA
ncbi:MAG: hypothetical protein H6812_13645 [Phycisphaeraceae bacterium]|nr:hypothetical protein [Phycisphaerales bacterium]MCB9844282.1 hypothetical protein [Phycisphaeraceae bacterium]